MDTASDVTFVLLSTWVITGVICSIIAGTVAGRKNRSGGGFFLLGLLLPVIGVVAALLAAPGATPPPLGMLAVTCPRCNAQQNVPKGQDEYQCWQCKLVSRAAAV